jgi:hypothetical protein
VHVFVATLGAHSERGYHRGSAAGRRAHSVSKKLRVSD